MQVALTFSSFYTPNRMLFTRPLPFVIPTVAKRSGGICGPLFHKLLLAENAPFPLSSRP
jgi:hypothetical protein